MTVPAANRNELKRSGIEPAKSAKRNPQAKILAMRVPSDHKKTNYLRMKTDSTNDFLFDKRFGSKITKETIRDFGDKDHESFLAACIAYILKYKQVKEPGNQISQQAFSRIKRQSLDLFREHEFRPSFSRQYRKIAVAASVMLIVGISGYLIGKRNLPFTHDREARIIEFSTPKGQQSEVTLPDGTFVALNYDSRLKYHVSQDRDLQKVELEGEAFFRVTKNKARTFRVMTSDMCVNVLGTEFDVRAYQDDPNIETILSEGSIEIDGLPARKETVLLSPGEQWKYNKGNQRYSVTKVNPRLATLWRTGEYYFDGVTLQEMARTLERMYKVNIRFIDHDLGKEIYSGSIYQQDGINKIFGMISLTIPVIVEIKGDEVLVKRR